MKILGALTGSAWWAFAGTNETATLVTAGLAILVALVIAIRRV